MKNPFARRRRTYWPVLVDIGAVLLAIYIFTAAVMPNLLHASAYFDEGYSAYLANLDVWSMAGYTALDVHPPLYYATLHVWQLFAGDSLTALRMMSVVFGWVAIVFGFLLVRQWFGRRAALFAILLMALSPLFIRYGGTMRMYTMALAIAFAASYVLLLAVRSKDKKLWIIYALLVAAGMWTNYFMTLVWATHAIWLLYEYRRNRKVIRAWGWSVLGALVLYLPWLPMLLLRYGEIQVNGFWIKPLSVDTLVSTVTQSLVFRNAISTTGWLAIGVVVLTATLAVVGWRVYQKLDQTKKSAFRLITALSSLPVILLAVGSLPPLRSSYVYRYILVAAVASCLLIAVILAYASFKRNDVYKRAALYSLTLVIFASGTFHAVTLGNRNLDTNTQNKLGQVMERVDACGTNSPVVVRSPYGYYAVKLYETTENPVFFIHTQNLEKMGSTKPLYDHPAHSIKSFDGLQKLWLVGEDRASVAAPAGQWKTIRTLVEYDDITKKPAAFAREFERIAS